MTGATLTPTGSRDMVKAAVTIQEWLTRQMDGACDVRVRDLGRTGGLSHEILKFEAEWTHMGRANKRGFVIRLDPVNYRKRIHPNLSREFEALSVLSRASNIPVPRPYWYETDTDLLGSEFYAMDQIHGRVATDTPPYQTHGWIAELDVPQRRKLWRNAIQTMARIGAFPTEALIVLRRDPSNDDDFAQHVKLWHETYVWAMDGRSNPISDAAWDWLVKNLPRNRPPGLSWGDARWANMMFDGVECNAVLDWEDVALASPLMDVGRWLMADALHARWGLPRLEGFGDRSATLDTWEEITGLSSADIRWYEIFSISCGMSGLARIQTLKPRDSGGPEAPAKMNMQVFNGLLEEWLSSV